jgi:formylglycine-generating enzyme required for sulfatase activity
VQTLAAHIDDGDWHEVSLLTIGYLGLVQQNDEVASAVLDDLLQLAPGAPGQAVLLAGECIADAWPGVTPACRQGVIEQLKTTLSQRQVNTQHRVACGRVLAHHNLGDPRSEITTIESMPFCYVPAGPFHMGSVDDEQAPANEKPQHLYDLTYPYWISRFPVSNAQFERFVAAGGYDNPSYWSEAQQHELWRAGQVRNVWYILNEKTELVVHHLGDWRRRYASIPEPFNLPNHPAIFLNWYEALAFSHWLEETLHAQGWLAVDWRVTLPSEPEWEKAARGGVQIVRRALQRSANNLSFPEKVAMIPNEMEHRRYPWGDNVDTEHMNYVESQIGSSSALGCYPAGASPYGVEELSGNVWEWTRSLWRTKADKPDFGYPYDAGDGRENLAAGDDTLRVLRGGSYNDDAAGVRCALRFGFNPFNRYVVIGFRVALSPSSSDF